MTVRGDGVHSTQPVQLSFSFLYVVTMNHTHTHTHTRTGTHTLCTFLCKTMTTNTGTDAENSCGSVHNGTL
jgi:hypothetical protein